ncbi:MAG: O-antigen ligase family protein [Porticoccaceae bacterium]
MTVAGGENGPAKGADPGSGASTSILSGGWRDAIGKCCLGWLLALFLVLAFVLDSRTGVINFLRLPLFLAVLLCVRGDDLRRLWANGAARWFILLMAWLTLTLLWDGVGEDDWKILQRGIQVLTLLLAVFAVAARQPGWQAALVKVFVLAGACGAALILWDWPGGPAAIAGAFPTLDRAYFYTRGIFTISIFTGWMMAVLFIAGFYLALSSAPRLALVFYVACLLFLAVMLASQARSAWLAAGCGFAMVVWGRQPRRLGWWLAAAVLVVGLAALLSDDFRSLLATSFDRGNSFRVAIWRNCVEQLLAAPWQGVVGFGLSASTVNLAGGAEHSHYHNLYLNTLYYGGLVALILYLGCLWQLVAAGVRGRLPWLWACLLLPMQLAFVVDGENFFVTPSAMMLGYLLPLFWAMTGWQPLRHGPDGAGPTGERGPALSPSSS